MESLRNVIQSIRSYKQATVLSVWDIDDTLYSTPTNVRIIHPDTKKIIASLSTAEYADFHSQGLEKIKEKYKTDKFTVDFSQFRDSRFFEKNAKKTAFFETALNEFRDKLVFFIVLTARDNMLDKDVFLSKFEKDGLKLRTDHTRSHLIRLAALGNKYPNKGSVLNEILNSLKNRDKPIEEVRYWDDSVTEVNSVSQIRGNFPNIRFRITKIIPRSK